MALPSLNNLYLDGKEVEEFMFLVNLSSRLSLSDEIVFCTAFLDFHMDP